jgi:hypothetical protein
MGEFFAWAITGQINRLRAWSDAGDLSETDGEDEERDATKLPKQQKFVLRSHDGRETEVHLVDSGTILRNGHIATIAWAAREGALHGHCIFVKNHITGVESRLEANIRYVRPAVKTGKLFLFGLLAAMPAALALLAWLLIPGSLADVDLTVFLLGSVVALLLLFCVGAIVAKLLSEYMRSEDDEKIWAAVAKAVAVTASDRQPQQPEPRLLRRS